ncbi:MAG: aldo/keto reductase [Segetibacter sp.]
MFEGEGVSKIGLGCVTFGREIDEQAAFRMMDYALSKGINFFDTAAAYGNGASETIIGKWLHERSEEKKAVVVATKILPPFNAENIVRLVNESLQRLKIETIDLLYLHRWDVTLEFPGSLQAINDLVTAGKVQTLGSSNFTTKQLSNSLKHQNENNFTQFQFVQNNHNLAVSDLSAEFKQLCNEHNINIITYSPLGAGFLTGKHEKGVQAGSRFDLMPGHQQVYFNEHAYKRLARLQQVAAQTGNTASHLALAWALHQPGIKSVLIGGRTTPHIDQAIAALAFNDKSILKKLEIN